MVGCYSVGAAFAASTTGSVRKVGEQNLKWGFGAVSWSGCRIVASALTWGAGECCRTFGSGRQGPLVSPPERPRPLGSMRRARGSKRRRGPHWATHCSLMLLLCFDGDLENRCLVVSTLTSTGPFLHLFSAKGALGPMPSQEPRARVFETEFPAEQPSSEKVPAADITASERTRSRAVLLANFNPTPGGLISLLAFCAFLQRDGSPSLCRVTRYSVCGGWGFGGDAQPVLGASTWSASCQRLKAA